MTTEQTIHEEMRERVELAFSLAEDGAFATAANIFKQVAQTYENRANEIQCAMDRFPKVHDILKNNEGR